MAYVYIVIVLALIEYMVLSGMVGWARGKYSIQAPATTGNPMFERYFRVQMNTLEGLVVFLPGLWLFATLVDATIAAILGLIGIIGRAVYAKLYVADPAKRGPGAAICGLTNMVLVLGSLYGAIRAAI